MKSDAIVSNMLNRNSVILKKCGTSYIANTNIGEQKESFSRNSSPIFKVDYSSSGMTGSKPIRTEQINIISKDKNPKKPIEIPCLFSDNVALRIPGGAIAFKYIRDWMQGSNSNGGNYWVELQAIDTNGVNVAQGMPVTSNYSMSSASYITDGNTNTSYYASGETGTLQYAQVELDRVYLSTEVPTIKTWHYYSDGRIFYKTKIEVSEDGVTWVTLWDSETEGTYRETSTGLTVNILNANINASASVDAFPSKYISDITTEIITEAKQVGTLKINSKESFISGNFKTNLLKKSLPAIKMSSIGIDQGYKSDVSLLTVDDKQLKNYSVFNSFKYASTVVATKVPVDTNGSNGSGEGLETLKLELVPFNYVKIHLGFTNNIIVNSIGLPPGLTIKDGCIEGSPLISGDYNIKLTLDNNSVVTGSIKVLVLDRIK